MDVAACGHTLHARMHATGHLLLLLRAPRPRGVPLPHTSWACLRLMIRRPRGPPPTWAYCGSAPQGLRHRHPAPGGPSTTAWPYVYAECECTLTADRRREDDNAMQTGLFCVGSRSGDSGPNCCPLVCVCSLLEGMSLPNPVVLSQQAYYYCVTCSELRSNNTN